MPEHIPTTQILAHGATALFGALTHALTAQRKGLTKSFSDFLALMVISSFSGLMFALMGMDLFGGDQYITLTMAGTGGFLGVEGMAWIVERIRNFLIK